MKFPRISRKRFIVRAAVPTLAASAGVRPDFAPAAEQPLEERGPGPIPVSLKINGETHTLALEPRVTLLDALRERLGLTGTKKGCDQGTCGACTVLVDGRRVNACLTLAVMAEGKAVTTIEGLGSPESLHPMQAAFLSSDGFQCGYCTPGQIVSAVGLVSERRPTSDDSSIRMWMSGNICRCGAYPNIVDAIRKAGRHA
ncbi:MAG TPA: 2Fe-2S iron-sulfur cluster-binding protein [Candidatus Baltobacteraceae bacterium]